MGWEGWLQNLGSGALGGLIVYGIQWARERGNEADGVKKVMSTISLELECLWDRFSGHLSEWIQQRNPDKEIWDESRMLLLIHAAEQNYFVGFDSMVHQIANLEDRELSKQIFKTYIAAKGMLDTLRLHNETAREYIELQKTGVSNEICVSSDAILEEYKALETLIEKTRESIAKLNCH